MYFSARKLLLVLLLCLMPAALSSQLFKKNEDSLELYKKGTAQYKQGEIDNAWESFEQFIKKYPNDFDVRNALFYMGEVRRRQERCFDAITLYRRLIDRYIHARHRSEAIFREGECYFKVSLRSKAMVLLADYIKTYPKGVHKVNALYYLGEEAFLGKRYLEAAGHYERIQLILDKKDSSAAKTEVSGQKPAVEKVSELRRHIQYRLGVIYARSYNDVPRAYRYLKPLLDDPDFKQKANVRFLLRDIQFFQLDSTNGLTDNTVSAISFDGDDIWLGMWLGGLARFTRSTGKFRIFTTKDGMVSNAVRDIYVDFDEVWVSTFDGICMYDKKTGKFKKITAHKGKLPNRVQNIYKDGRYIYFATLGYGVSRYDRIKEIFEPLEGLKKLGISHVQKVTGGKNFILFSTLGRGIVIYDRKADSYTRLSLDEGLPGSTVNDALVDGRYLWIAVYGHGLVRYDTVNKEMTHFKPKIDTVHPIVTSLRRRGVEIWAATLGGGVRIYDKHKETWRRLSAIEGLPTNEIRQLEMEQDYVWMGTLDQGVTIMYAPQNTKSP